MRYFIESRINVRRFCLGDFFEFEVLLGIPENFVVIFYEFVKRQINARNSSVNSNIPVFRENLSSRFFIRFTHRTTTVFLSSSPLLVLLTLVLRSRDYA